MKKLLLIWICLFVSFEVKSFNECRFYKDGYFQECRKKESKVKNISRDVSVKESKELSKIRKHTEELKKKGFFGEYHKKESKVSPPTEDSNSEVPDFTKILKKIRKENEQDKQNIIKLDPNNDVQGTKLLCRKEPSYEYFGSKYPKLIGIEFKKEGVVEVFQLKQTSSRNPEYELRFFSGNYSSNYKSVSLNRGKFYEFYYQLFSIDRKTLVVNDDKEHVCFFNDFTEEGFINSYNKSKIRSRKNVDRKNQEIEKRLNENKF